MMILLFLLFYFDLDYFFVVDRLMLMLLMILFHFEKKDSTVKDFE